MRLRLFASGCALWFAALLAAEVPGAQETPARTAHSGAAFQTADQCLACHNGLTAPSGEDVSIGSAWRGSMMANSARDPYWQAAVRRETMDHPEAAAEIENECGHCHMPMASTMARAGGAKGAVFAHLTAGQGATAANALAADGVSCTLCHQIQGTGFGQPASFNGGFTVNAAPAGEAATMLGPFEVDRGRAAIMESATGVRPSEGVHVAQSELCATCHTLYTTAHGRGGEVIGRLPEQVPYLEWRHSAFRTERSCQACHMPTVGEPTAIAAVLGEPREGLSRHTFVGGNFFMLRLFNRHRTELGVIATPAELDAAAVATLRQLRDDTATLSVEARTAPAGGALEVDVTVTNLTGHKLPTAYPSRRAWLHVTVRDRSGRTLFESGAIDQRGAIRGNAADADGRQFEPHYREIVSDDQVQIYESVMVDQGGSPTTGLLTGVRYVKDNRLLPRGFDATTAEADIAVRGDAERDPDFTGGSDRVRYRVPVGTAAGPFQVEVALRYQPIGFRWADNLRSYDAAEPRRFVRYYDAAAGESSALIARASARVE